MDRYFFCNGGKDGCIIVEGDWLVIIDDEREKGEFVITVIGGLWFLWEVGCEPVVMRMSVGVGRCDGGGWKIRGERERGEGVLKLAFNKILLLTLSK